MSQSIAAIAVMPVIIIISSIVVLVAREHFEVGFAKHDAEQTTAYFWGGSQLHLHDIDSGSTPLDDVDIRIDDARCRARIRYWRQRWKIDDDVIVMLPQPAQQVLETRRREDLIGMSKARINNCWQEHKIAAVVGVNGFA